MSDLQMNCISSILSAVDKIGADMVSKTYQNIVNHYSPLIYTLVAIYLGFSFIKAMRGQMAFNDLLFIFLRIILILTLAMKYHYFGMLIYDLFTNAPLEICKAITVNGSDLSVQSLSSAIDNYLNQGLDLVTQIFKMGSWSNPTYFIFGFTLFSLIGLSAAFAAGLMVLSKCATIVLLSLSPLFIFAGLFDSTKGLFDGFIRQLITYALIPIMTCAVLMILISVSQMGINDFNAEGSPSIKSMMPLCLISIIQMYLLLQVRAKCAALAGGFSLPAVMATLGSSASHMGQATGGMVSAISNGASSLKKGLSSMGISHLKLNRFKQAG